MLRITAVLDGKSLAPDENPRITDTFDITLPSMICRREPHSGTAVVQELGSPTITWMQSHSPDGYLRNSPPNTHFIRQLIRHHLQVQSMLALPIFSTNSTTRLTKSPPLLGASL
ncbi:MAG: hypothetical protein KDB22_07955 [Planctomycetales bacterium]|nr:hypothetical protein [Planctomycetales bacterium]